MTRSRAAFGEVIVHAMLLANFAITRQGSVEQAADAARITSVSRRSALRYVDHAVRRRGMGAGAHS